MKVWFAFITSISHARWFPKMNSQTCTSADSTCLS